ncbi:hypothetical protein LIER_12876 [Lithospermum erythrorhizon]|uniref:Uncharacterized protein n=1 Tax=Lithospermum erythrorhizon TaxID=34254 RepID=A0AAV3PUX2_LITER
MISVLKTKSDRNLDSTLINRVVINLSIQLTIGNPLVLIQILLTKSRLQPKIAKLELGFQENLEKMIYAVNNIRLDHHSYLNPTQLRKEDDKVSLDQTVHTSNVQRKGLDEVSCNEVCLSTFVRHGMKRKRAVEKSGDDDFIVRDDSFIKELQQSAKKKLKTSQLEETDVSLSGWANQESSKGSSEGSIRSSIISGQDTDMVLNNDDTCMVLKDTKPDLIRSKYLHRKKKKKSSRISLRTYH